MDRINPDLDFMDVLSFESNESLSFARNALMDQNVEEPNQSAASSTDEIHSSFQKLLRKVNNRNSKFQRAIFQKRKNYLNLTTEMLTNNDIYHARVRIIPHMSDAINRFIIQIFTNVYIPKLKYNFNGTDHIYTLQNIEHEKSYVVNFRIRASINKKLSLFILHFFNIEKFSTRFKNSKKFLLRTIKTSIPLFNDDDSKLLLNFDFLRSSYLDRHSDPTLLNFWENIVLNWKPFKIMDDDNYELLEKYLSDRFNFDLNSEMDENNLQKISDYLKQLKILNTTKSERNILRKYTIVGLIRIGNAFRIEYNDFGKTRQSDSIFNYYVNKRNYTLQHLTLLRLNTENKMISILPTESCEFKNKVVQLGHLTNRTLKVIQIISGLTDDQYCTLQNKIQIEKCKQNLNLNQFYYQICQQQ